MNAGGDEDVAMQVAARFADMPRVVTHSQFRAGAHRGDYTPIAAHVLSPRGTWRFTRPVILLVGRGSWSATESFVSAMREFPQVTVVGDTTGGGTGNPALYSLRAGWGFSLSRWIEYTARMETIEGRGIAPDLAVPVKIQSLAKGRDETLATALVMAKHLAARANPR